MSRRKSRLAKNSNHYWCIEFYSPHPGTGELKRFRRTFGINRIKDLHEREIRARQILEELPYKIKHGYPYVNVELRRQWHRALPYALSFKLRSDREKTRVTYSSHAGVFENYLKKKGLWKKDVNEFTRVDAIDFLDHIQIKRELSATTINNYRMTMRAILNELVKREILKTNPFSKIQKQKETQKVRRPLSDYEKKVIINYAAENDRLLLLIISLVYYTFIRPVELRRLKVKHVNLQQGIITLPGEITKNKETSHLTIPNELNDILITFNFHEWDPDHFLFGARMQRSEKRCGHHTISRRHLNACKFLKSQNKLQDITGIQLYSWKDTGALDFVQSGVPINELMSHLRHKNLSTTQVYLNSFAEINKNIKEKAKRLL